MSEFQNLSDSEIAALIKRAEEELVRRKAAARDRLKEEIEEKLRASGLGLGDLFPEIGVAPRKADGESEGAEKKAVKPKYFDPVSQQAWSGRGARPPHWVKRIMAERGWTLEEFKASGEFDD
ncbi:MAG: H-NS family nucleoid-associated regulatory protein [Methylocystis sp.]|uniref:H-NS histone family protein n=1 Tax=Methylocystis sp. TaxID=1911079 RepID=UPI003DA4C88E